MTTLKQLKTINEVKETVKTAEGSSVTSDLKLSKLKGNKHAYLSLTGHKREKGEKEPNMFGTIHHEILKAHPDGKYHLASMYHLHIYAPGEPEHGEPMHAHANAHYHAGIGQYSKENAQNLADHLVTSTDHAQSIIDNIKHVHTDSDKKAIVDAHVNAMRPKWKEHMDHIVKSHGLEVEHG